MEPDNLPSCDLCTKPLQYECKLSFSCNHTFCFRCIPYMVYKIINTFGIRQNFFNDTTSFKCLVCDRGQINQLPENLMKFFELNLNKGPSLKRKALYEIKCESCEEKDAKFCCLGCSQQKYCEDCLKFHQKNKKFSEHKIVCLDELKQMSENTTLDSNQNCNCAFRKNLEYFCQECQISTKYCSKSHHHHNHKLIWVSEFSISRKKWNSSKYKKNFQNL